MTMIDPKGSRPGTLVKSGKVACNDDDNPVREGVEATEETAPVDVSAYEERKHSY